MATLSGVVHHFGLKSKRPFIVVTLPFGEARVVFKPDIYRATTGQGEQREQKDTHIRHLRRETLDDNITPAPFTAGLRDQHQKYVTITKQDGRTIAAIDLPEGESIPLTDGGHRNRAWEDLLNDGTDGVLDFPIVVMVMLEGDTQKDFLNLQKGRPVDPSHILSLKVQAGEAGKTEEEKEELNLAFDTALALSKHANSPFYKQIRFDSRGLAPLPLSTLCSRGASDCLASLVGLARAGLQHGDGNCTPAWLCDVVIEMVKELTRGAPELLQPGWYLTPPPDGSKGSATMLLGVASLLVHRAHLQGRDKPDYDDYDAMLNACRRVFDTPVSGSFSGPDKRLRLGQFAEEFFADLDVEKHAGVPVSVVKLFSTSSMRLPKMERQKKTSSGCA